jgi:hypothetical protein
MRYSNSGYVLLGALIEDIIILANSESTRVLTISDTLAALTLS